MGDHLGDLVEEDRVGHSGLVQEDPCQAAADHNRQEDLAGRSLQEVEDLDLGGRKHLAAVDLDQGEQSRREEHLQVEDRSLQEEVLDQGGSRQAGEDSLLAEVGDHLA